MDKVLHKYVFSEITYSHLSKKRNVKLTDFGKFHPAQNNNLPCTFIDFIKTFNILTEPNEDFSHGHFEL